MKMRGFDIELDKIESILSQHPLVYDSVVLCREDESDDKRLVAYVVTKSKQDSAIGEICDYLKAKFPDYMIPSMFVVLDRLPLTPDGKIDCEALPIPDNIESRKEYVAPSNHTEKMLADMWSDVLGIGKVGIYDDFFDLGGNSLLAFQVISMLIEKMPSGIPLTLLFKFRTIAELAEFIEGNSCYFMRGKEEGEL